eukprot:COSAG02_NODE_2081_length_9898_cov_45.797539_5_plen_76_part_00
MEGDNSWRLARVHQSSPHGLVLRHVCAQLQQTYSRQPWEWLSGEGAVLAGAQSGREKLTQKLDERRLIGVWCMIN